MTLKSFILVEMISNMEVLTLGRENKNYLVLEDDSISKVHSLIKVNN